MAGSVKHVGGSIKVWDVTLTVAAEATTATATSDGHFNGYIRKIEIDPGAAMATSATLKMYEANTPLATGTRDHFLNYTFPASEVEFVIYPHVAGKENDATAADPTVSVPYVVCDQLRADLASAVAADSVRIRVYVEEC